MLAELECLLKDFRKLVVIYTENPSLEDRVRNTGILRPEKAREICAVGIVARASGMNLDCRIFNPFPPYDQYDRLELDVPVMITGDVHARTWVRIQEVRESIRIIRWILENLPEGPISAGVTGASFGQGGLCGGRRMAGRDNLLAPVRTCGRGKPVHGQGPFQRQLART